MDAILAECAGPRAHELHALKMELPFIHQFCPAKVCLILSLRVQPVSVLCSLEEMLGEDIMTQVKKMRLLQRKGGEMDPKKVRPRVPHIRVLCWRHAWGFVQFSIDSMLNLCEPCRSELHPPL